MHHRVCNVFVSVKNWNLQEHNWDSYKIKLSITIKTTLNENYVICNICSLFGDFINSQAY